MQKEFYYDNNPECTLWDGMWQSRTIEQELQACDIERPPRELFLAHLSKEDKIIDAGCGFGKWVNYLHRRGYNIVGIDNNEFAISRLKEFDGTLQVEKGDILNIDYPDNYFGAYISMGVVEHFEEGPQAPLKEAYRVLRPGGLIFVSVPTVNLIRRIFRRPVRNFIGSLYRAIEIFAKNKYPFYIRFIDASRQIIGGFLPEKAKNILLKRNNRYCHFTEYRYTKRELNNFLKEEGFEVLKLLPHDFYDSREHAIGLTLDIPLFKDTQENELFKLNLAGKIVSRILDGISPWIACASVICVARSSKKD